MKIAFIVSQFPVMSESFIVQQIVGLLDKGCDVRIFSFMRSDQAVIQKEVLEHNLLGKTTLLQLPKKKWRLRVMGMAYLAACFFYSPRAAIRFLGLCRKASVFLYQDLCLTFHVLRGRFDVVHAHFGPIGLRSLILKKLDLPVKLITTLYGYDLATYVRQRGTDVYQDLFRRGDLFIYISEAGKEKMLALGGDDKKMVKIPMGIRTSEIPFRERQPVPSETFRLLSVGRLVEMKGREYAIRAAASLMKRYSIRYDILGDGPLRRELQDLIETLKVSDTIKLWGWVDTDKRNEMYENAHVFIHPSVTSSDGNQEGQGVVLLEAQAYGIPVVATRHGAFPDSVIDGKTGFLVPEKDVEKLASAIEYLFNHSEQWPEIGRQGRTFVETAFEAEKLCNRQIEIYKNMLVK